MSQSWMKSKLQNVFTVIKLVIWLMKSVTTKGTSVSHGPQTQNRLTRPPSISAQAAVPSSVAAAKASNDIVVTLAMAALNIMLVGGIVVILVRMVLAERKEAAAGGGKEQGDRKSVV